MRPLVSMKLTSVEVAMQVTSASPANHQPPQSPWHSPVPYLFGGLAAMLGLIAFALLLLACSYWRLSASASDAEAGNGGAGGEDGGEKESRSGDKAANAAYEEKVLVIMAGEDSPTFLATPAIIKSLATEGKTVISEEEEDGAGEKMGEEGEKVKGDEEPSH